MVIRFSEERMRRDDLISVGVTSAQARVAQEREGVEPPYPDAGPRPVKSRGTARDSGNIRSTASSRRWRSTVSEFRSRLTAFTKALRPLFARTRSRLPGENPLA